MVGAMVAPAWSCRRSAPEALADLGVSRETPQEDHGMGSFRVTFLGILPGNLASKAAYRGVRAISGTCRLSSYKLVGFFAGSVVIALSMA